MSDQLPGEFDSDLTPQDIIEGTTAEEQKLLESYEELGNLLAGRASALGIYRNALLDQGFREKTAEEIVRDWHLEYISTRFESDPDED